RARLFSPAWCFAPAGIMHRLPVKFTAWSGCNSSTRRPRTGVPVTKVVGVIHMTVEVSRTAIIRTRADEHAVCKPVRTVIPVRSAVVWRGFVVPIWTHRGSRANRDPKMCRPACSRRETSQSNRKNSDVSYCHHRVYPYLLEPVGREVFLEEL